MTIPALGTADRGTRALARYWAHRSAADFPDGQLHLDLRGTDPTGPLDPSDGLRAALLALGLPDHLVPPEPDRRSAWFRRLLNGKRILILLEDARDEHQVRPFLPDSTGTLLLVTAPSRLDDLAANHGAVPLTPNRLTEAESLVLLTAYLGAHRIADDPAAARRLITRCDHQRLALGILAAQAFRHPGTSVDELLRELDTVSSRRTDGGMEPGGTSTDDGGIEPSADDAGIEPNGAATDDLESAVNIESAEDVESAALSLCYQGLSEPAAAMLRSFGLVDGPDLGVDALAALVGRAPEELSAPLRELVAANLIGEHHPGRYRCPAPVRRFALDTSRRTDSTADRRSARHRVLRHYRDTSADAASLFHSPTPHSGTFATTAAALTWWDVERVNLTHAVAQAQRLAFNDLAVDLARSLTTFWQLRHHPADWLHTHQHALRAAQTEHDPDAETALQTELATAYQLLGLPNTPTTPEARTPQQDPADPNPADPLTESRHWHEQGQRSAAEADFPTAIHHFEQAVQTQDQIGNVTAATDSLFHLARTAFADNDPILARESFRQAESRYLTLCEHRLTDIHRILTTLDHHPEPADHPNPHCE